MGQVWGSFVQLIITALVSINDLVGSYGLAIILFTFLVRLITLPLTLQQIRSSKAMQELAPQLERLRKKYSKNKDKLAREQMKLYQEAGVNPAAGCLPMLIQMPVWIALYSALRDMAAGDNPILKEGFLWIPSLAEPHQWPPPEPMWAYLVLPVLTVISQYVVQKMMSPSTAAASDDPTQSAMNQMMLFMPLMFGFFAVQVPSGLALYWVTSNIFSLVQQYFITGWGSLIPQGVKTSEVASETGAKRKRKHKGKR
ncbi:MAG: YidC/Oxa1 family membrane protein insertase [Anaerolineae bacterium]